MGMVLGIVAVLALLGVGYVIASKRSVKSEKKSLPPPPSPLAMLQRIDPGRDKRMDLFINEVGRHSDPSKPLEDPSSSTMGGIPEVARVQELEEHFQTDPKNIALLNLLAYQYFLTHRIPEALKMYELGLTLKPADPTLMYYLGECLFMSGRQDEARRLWTGVAKANKSEHITDRCLHRLSKTAPKTG